MIFNQKQTEFIEREFGIKIQPNVDVQLEKKVYDYIMDETFLIEGLESDIAEGCPLSERGKIAVSIGDLGCIGRSGKKEG